jgi:hypothetical protein
MFHCKRSENAEHTDTIDNCGGSYRGEVCKHNYAFLVSLVHVRMMVTHLLGYLLWGTAYAIDVTTWLYSRTSASVTLSTTFLTLSI